MVPQDKLAQITQRFEFLEARLNAGAAPAEIAQVAREYSDLKPVAEEIAAYVAAEPAYDCAGGFKCEGLGISLLDRLYTEDPTALIGLPLVSVSRALRAWAR